MRQTAIGTQEVATNVVTVKDAATTTGRTASQLMTAAGSLKEQSEQLASELDSFLQAVRAA